jgi:hypothetical protein
MHTVTRPRQNRKPLKPVSGSVRVLRPVGAVNAGVGEVSINEKPYFLQVMETGYRLYGYDERNRAVTSYDLPLDLSSCDCPDATYRGERPEGCKHRKALAALKHSGKLS